MASIANSGFALASSAPRASAAAAAAGANTSSSASKSSSSSARIADNFDQFLQLLTTQLKNQSPLDPLDTNQFTQQLVQFASVEQQIKTNDNLSSLLITNKTANLNNALSFVGARVTADGTTSSLKNGSASWQLNAPRVGTSTITILDANGNEVASKQVTLTAGDQTFGWDGKMANGQTAPEGQYKIVVAAKDANGQAMAVKSEISGVVDGVDVTGDVPILQIGDISLPVTLVKSIRR
ncbi:MAG: flagellar basal-body rod modification protein [Beijerinckiaceae bacterium]|nr:MAG: flagellar basal-body rod modification protein [Beijerinckiaceae bacterium]